MNIKSVLIVLAAVIAGTLGGAVAYQVAVPAGNAQPPATESIVLESPQQAARQAQPRVKFAPCKPPAQREGKRCVTDVVRTVTVSASTPSPAPAPSGSSGSSFNDDRRHGDDDSGHGGDDDDDNSGHGGGDDDDTGTHTQTRTQGDTNTGTNTGTQTRTRD
jgi:hypothetical protein